MALEVESRPLVTSPAIEGTRATTSRRELDLYSFALLLRKNRRRILIFSAVGFLLGLILAFTTKPTFTSTSVLLVPKPAASTASLALQMATGGGLDLTGGGYEVYEDILHSRTVSDRVIQKYNLKAVYGTKDMASTRQILSKRTTLTSGKEGIVRIAVEDTDPKRAADLANDYLDELDRMNQQLAITSASQQRAFFERELIKEKDALADAEVDLKRTQEETGVLVPQGQAMANLSAEESLRAQLRLRQVQLNSLLQGATEQNPDVIRLQAEIAGMQSQLQTMRTGNGGNAPGPSGSKTPQSIALENLRKAREVKFHETLFEMLGREYETAKQNEAKTVSMIQVLDRAVPAEHKSWPPRSVFCLLGIIVGGILGICYVLAAEFRNRVVQNPDNQRKYQELFEDTRIARR